MGTPAFLKSLSYWPSLRKAVRVLHFQHLARRWYYVLSRPKGNVLRLGIDRIGGQFYVRTPTELRVMESEILVEKEALKLLVSTLRAGDVFYEIGASAGIFTVLLAKAGAQVFAFEPMSENYDRLQENLELNGIINVHSFRMGLADWNGEGRLFVAGQNGISLGARLLGAPTGRGRYEVVEVHEGDQLREVENLPCPRAVHIDVEGYEYAVIRGLRQTLGEPACRLVCCEIHPALLPKGIEPDAVLGLLRSLGFGRIDTHVRNNAFHLVAYKAGFQSND